MKHLEGVRTFHLRGGHDGMSLVEVLVTMGIGIVVGVLLLTVIVSSTGLFYKQSSKLQEGLNVNDILTKIRGIIKSSSGVVASASLGGTNYTSGATQIIFKLPAIDSSNNLIPDTYDYFVFLQDEKKFSLKTFPDPSSSRKAQDQVFTTSVDKVEFQYFNSDNPPLQVNPEISTKVRITLTLKQKSGADYEVITATSEAYLRND